MKYKKLMSLIICACVFSPNAAAICSATANEIDCSAVQDNVLLTETEVLMSEEEYFQQTIEQYGDFDYSDPQNRIAKESVSDSAREKAFTDEKLFGIWDSSSGQWTAEPYINYDANEYKGLSLKNVEECVKNGDYDGAKEELLAYYRLAYARHDRSDVEKHTERRQLLTAQAAFDNLIRSTGDQANVVEKFTLTTQEQTFNADVLADVVSTQNSVNKNVAYILVALKKDGYTGIFNSKEAEDNQPYLQLTVNGTVRKIYPSADNTLRAGTTYKNTSYGSDTTLNVEESYSTIGKKEPVDNYTQRGYLRFDLSEINSGDSISDARLYLTGHMVQSDNPETPDVEHNSKDIFLWKSGVVTWNENNFTWSNCSDHEIFSYDGERGANFSYKGGGSSGTKVIPSLQDNTSKFTSYIYNTARAYKGTGEEAYAYHTIRLLMHSIATFAERFPDDPTIVSDYTYGKNSYFHNAGQRAKFMGEILSCVIDSEYMTPDAFTALMKHSYLLCVGLVNGWGGGQEGNNIGSLQIEGLFKLCTIMREFNRFYEPLDNDGKPAISGAPGSVRGGWFEVIKYRMSYKVKQDLFSDGSSIEVGLGYADLNLSTFLNNMVAAVNVGMDGDNLLDDEGMEALEKYAVYLLNASNPQFGDWQQGHAYSYTTNYMGDARAAKYLKFIKDPRILWAASGGEKGKAPDYTSVVYNVGKKAVLRSAWDKNSVAMQINADGGQKSHGQSDDLGLNLYAYGQYLLVDPLYHNYTANHPMNIFLNSTRAHNTVEINDTSQKSIVTAVQTIGNKDQNGDVINTPGGSVMGSLHEENQELNTAYDFIRAETLNYKNNNYDGPISERNSNYTEKIKTDFKEYRDILFIKPDFAIVSDYIEPSRDDVENKYSQNWHFMPGTAPEMDVEKNSVKTNTDLANLQIVSVNGSQEIDEIKEKPGYYAVTAGTEIENPYYSFIKNKKGVVTFNTILYPTRPGEDKTVTANSISTGVDETIAAAFDINITDNRKGVIQTSYYYAVMGDNEAADRSFGNYSTNGSNAYIAPLSSGYETAILRNGSYIKDNGKYLLMCNNELKDISVSWNGGAIRLYSADINSLADADSLSVYAPKGNETVYLNDSKISISRKGNYVYIGTAPSEIPSETIAPTQKPSTGVGGGGGNAGGGHGSGVNGGGSVNGSGETVITPTQSPVATPTPSDFESELKGHWGETEIRNMIERGIVSGYDNDSLGLKSEITRAEFVTMIVRAMGYELPEYNNEFSDVSADDWYAVYLSAAYKNGVLDGDDMGNAHPNRKLTREEMAKIMVSLYMSINDVEEHERSADFTDKDEISVWAQPYVATAQELGLVYGVEDGKFAPKQSALREQAIVVLHRMLNIK